MKAEQQFPWWTAGLAVVLVLGALASGLRLPKPPAPTGTEVYAPSFALIVPASAQEETLLHEWWAVHSAAPLYQATGGGWETATDLSRTDAPVLGEEFLPKLKQAADKPARPQISGPDPAPGDPIQALALTDRLAAMPLAFARSDPKVVPLAKRIGRVEVVAANGGQVVWSKDLPYSAGGQIEIEEWQPFEMMGAVSATGLVGDLKIMRGGSGSTKIDSFFRDLLVSGEQVGAKLRPGTYLFRIGP
ncbi:MAG: hypothetical protein WCL04_05665 [Verrucomicrobiota bacterium]